MNRKQAVEISEKTRQKVLERQGKRSVSGAGLYPYATEYHHVIPRSSSGVGYEWNIVALTSEEHRCYHDRQPIKVNGRVRFTWEEFDTLIRNHLKIAYVNWTEQNCKYKKYADEKDYEVYRRNKRLSVADATETV